MRPHQILFIFLFNLSGALAPFASAQTPMQSIHESGREIMKVIEDRGHELVHLEFDILSSTVPSKSVIRTLSSDYTYQVGVLGGEGISDIDLTVYKLRGDNWVRILDLDTDESYELTEGFIPDADLYRFLIVADEFAPGANGGHFSLVVSHDLPTAVPSPVSTSDARYKIITTETSKGYYIIETDREKITSSGEEYNTWTIYESPSGGFTKFQQRAGRTPRMFEITEPLENSGENKIFSYKATDDNGEVCLLFLNLNKSTITHYYSDGVEGKLTMRVYKFSSILDLKDD